MTAPETRDHDATAAASSELQPAADSATQAAADSAATPIDEAPVAAEDAAAASKTPVDRTPPCDGELTSDELPAVADPSAPAAPVRSTAPARPQAAAAPVAEGADALSLRETLPMAQPESVVIRRSREAGLSNDETAEVPLAPFLFQAGALDQSGEVSGWGSLLMRQRSSFFRQVFLWLLAISLLMSIGSGAIYYSRQLAFIEEDRQQRADLLLGYLATQSQLGAFAGDKVLLESPVRRMTDQKDVMWVAVYDSHGKELIKSAGRSGLPPPEPPFGLLGEMLQATRRDAALAQKKNDIFAQSVAPKHNRSLNIEKWNCLDLYAPIIISERGGPGVAAYVSPSDRLRYERVVGIARVGLSLETANERLRDVVRWGVGLGLLLLALGATAAYFIAGRISVPILELVSGADEIRNGNLHPRIKIHRNDELGMLAESFMRMAERLRETMSALSRLNRDLESEVKRRTRQIRLAYAFTSVLNSPIDRSDELMDAADLTVMLDQALAALVEATGTRGGGVFLTDDSGEGSELLVRAAYGVSTHTLGPPPPLKEVLEQRPRTAEGVAAPLHEAVQVVGRKLLVPLVFRNHPLGLLVLILPSEDPPEQTLLEFVRQAAAQLAIAVSNARAYARMTQLATELRQRTETLAAQRDQVRAQRDQLQHQRNQLEEQRNQLAAQSIQLRIQRNQLREVNRLKSEFLANVSHELRTPLNAIMGYSELIRDEIYGPITLDAREAVSGVLASSSNLLRLINQILDLSRIEAGKMELYFEQIDLFAVCSAVIREAEAMGRDRPYRVQLSCPSGLCAHTDAVKLQQILTNLVANSIKFTAQGAVHVNVRELEDGDVLIEVRDTGIGIKPEHLELIFEEFRQVDGSSTRRFGGTGLGLAIARRLAEMLGASISVESAFGAGSTFSVRLPRTPPPRPAGRSRPKDADSNPFIGFNSDPDLQRLMFPSAAAEPSPADKRLPGQPPEV